MPEITTQPSSGGQTTSGSSSRVVQSQEERISYVVRSGETMNAIAAKFDMTPSELARINRISVSSMLFEGRKLSIPARKHEAVCDASARAEQTEREADTSVNATESASVVLPQTLEHEPEATLPGTLHSCSEDSERASTTHKGKDPLSSLMIPTRKHSPHSARDSNLPAVQSRARLSHVLKIDARHITDGQGVVSGTLLITPNNLMFSPNVSDLIVIEHGTEHYEVTAPIEMIAGAALYSDIAIMRTKLHQKPVVCNIPVHVYYAEEPRAETSPPSPDNLAKRENFSANLTPDASSECCSTKTPPSSPIISGGVSREPEESENSDRTIQEQSRGLREPEMFAALKKLLPEQTQSQDNVMLYLCLRMGKPLNKVVKIPAVAMGRKKLKFEYWFGIPRNRVDEVYKFFQRNYPEKYGDVLELNMSERGFEELESDDEHEGKLEDQAFIPQNYVSKKENRRSEGEEVKLPETPPKSADGALTGVLNRVGSFKNPFKLPRFFEGPNTPHPSFSSCEWDVIAFKEDKEAPNRTSSTNLLNALTPEELLLPDMIDESEILDEEHRKILYKVIPARTEGYAWRLVYSSTRNGFSLKTFYREMNRHDGPVLLAITDTEGALFGAFVSTTIHPSDHFYGTGEMFLWSFHPTFNKYPWSGENQYFVKGNAESLVFGSGDGEFGLYLDGDLYHGRSSSCKTFNNEVLSKTNDFVIKSLEAWGFF